MFWILLNQSPKIFEEIHKNNPSSGLGGDLLYGIVILGILIYVGIYVIAFFLIIFNKMQTSFINLSNKSRKTFREIREYLFRFSYFRKKIFLNKSEEAVDEILKIGREFHDKGKQKEYHKMRRSIYLKLRQYDKRMYPYLLDCIMKKNEHLGWMLCRADKSVMKYYITYYDVLKFAEDHIKLFVK